MVVVVVLLLLLLLNWESRMVLLCEETESRCTDRHSNSKRSPRYLFARYQTNLHGPCVPIGLISVVSVNPITYLCATVELNVSYN